MLKNNTKSLFWLGFLVYWIYFSYRYTLMANVLLSLFIGFICSFGHSSKRGYTAYRKKKEWVNNPEYKQVWKVGPHIDDWSWFPLLFVLLYLLITIPMLLWSKKTWGFFQ